MGQQSFPAHSCRSSQPASIAATRFSRIGAGPRSVARPPPISPEPRLAGRSRGLVCADLDQVGHLVQGEAQALRCLDDPQRHDRLLVVEAVAAGAAVRVAQESAPLVVPEGLAVDSCRSATWPARRVMRPTPRHRPAMAERMSRRSGGTGDLERQIVVLALNH